tara:strand:+ start:17993 stop:18364 length:372 start_codon:yes stop_codon:yes gene_type:complete
MIGTVLKYSVTIGLSYIVLSFQYNDKYLFDYLTDLTGPLGKNIQHSLTEAFDSSWNKTKSYSKQLFTNSAPFMEEKYQETKKYVKKDIVPKVRAKKAKVEQAFLDDLKQEEMNHLDKIIDTEK